MKQLKIGSPYGCVFRFDAGNSGMICQFDALSCNDDFHPPKDCPLVKEEMIMIINRMEKKNDKRNNNTR